MPAVRPIRSAALRASVQLMAGRPAQQTDENSEPETCRHRKAGCNALVGVKSFYCALCKKKDDICSRDDLIKHVRECQAPLDRHSQESPVTVLYICNVDLCRSVFRSIDDCESHLENVHRKKNQANGRCTHFCGTYVPVIEESDRIVWVLCGGVFSTDSVNSRHKRRDHIKQWIGSRGDNIPAKCPICNMGRRKNIEEVWETAAHFLAWDDRISYEEALSRLSTPENLVIHRRTFWDVEFYIPPRSTTRNETGRNTSVAARPKRQSKRTARTRSQAKQTNENPSKVPLPAASNCLPDVNSQVPPALAGQSFEAGPSTFPSYNIPYDNTLWRSLPNYQGSDLPSLPFNSVYSHTNESQVFSQNDLYASPSSSVSQPSYTLGSGYMTTSSLPFQSQQPGLFGDLSWLPDAPLYSLPVVPESFGPLSTQSHNAVSSSYSLPPASNYLPASYGFDPLDFGSSGSMYHSDVGFDYDFNGFFF